MIGNSINAVAHRIVCEEYGIECYIPLKIHHSREKKLRNLIITALHGINPVAFDERGVFMLSSGETLGLIVNNTTIRYKGYHIEFIKDNYNDICKNLLNNVFDTDLLYHINLDTKTIYRVEPNIIKNTVIERLADMKFSRNIDYWDFGYNSLVIDGRVIIAFDRGTCIVNLKNMIGLCL